VSWGGESLLSSSFEACGVVVVLSLGLERGGAVGSSGLHGVEAKELF